MSRIGKFIETEAGMARRKSGKFLIMNPRFLSEVMKCFKIRQ
jgi:hypothetical protein